MGPSEWTRGSPVLDRHGRRACGYARVTVDATSGSTRGL